jgi:hypothetical protein
VRTKLLCLLPPVAAASAALGAPVSDFSLEDVNPASPRFESAVSPQNYLLQVSAFYFGTANT